MSQKGPEDLRFRERNTFSRWVDTGCSFQLWNYLPVWLWAERFCCGKEKWRDIYQSCRLKWCIGIWRSLKHTESSLWCFLCVSNAERELAGRNWLSQSFTFLKSQSHARDALFNTVATGYMWLFCIWNVVIQIEIFYKYTKYRRFWWININ